MWPLCCLIINYLFSSVLRPFALILAKSKQCILHMNEIILLLALIKDPRSTKTAVLTPRSWVWNLITASEASLLHQISSSFWLRNWRRPFVTMIRLKKFDSQIVSIIELVVHLVAYFPVVLLGWSMSFYYSPNIYCFGRQSRRHVRYLHYHTNEGKTLPFNQQFVIAVCHSSGPTQNHDSCKINFLSIYN